jgi:hypothetical protein
MFGKVKHWLGIEGVKLKLIVPEEIRESDKELNGKIQFHSMNKQIITSISVKMIEKYSRGKRKDKLVDEYLLGKIQLEQKMEIPSEEIVEIDFTLPFEIKKSEMDDLENKNIFMKRLVKTAKWFNSVKSEFRIIAEANVEGVALAPFDKKIIAIKK